MEKIKVLFCTDSISSVSGLADVAINFLKRFDKNRYEIALTTITGKDSEINHLRQFLNDKEFEKWKDIKIYNTQIMDTRTCPFFDTTIEEFEPHLVISFLDPWYIDQIAYSRYRKTYCWISYLTIETNNYTENVMCPTPIIQQPRKNIASILQNADLIIPVTTMGREVLLNNLKLKNVNNEHIFNGVDTSYVDKIEKMNLTKERIFGSAFKDKFIFMTMGKNTERKRIDLVIEAFSKFLKKVSNPDNYILYAHTNGNDYGPANGTDLGSQVNELGLLKKVIFCSELTYQNRGVSKETLYQRYSICDCAISLSGGEGFNYCTAEAMLFGLPIIYTDFGGHTTYCSSAGLPVKVAYYLNAKNYYMQWGLADTDDAANKMIEIVNNEALRKQLSKNGKEYAFKNLDWDIIFYKFINVIENKLEDFLNKDNKYKQFKLKKVM